MTSIKCTVLVKGDRTPSKDGDRFWLFLPPIFSYHAYKTPVSIVILLLEKTFLIIILLQ